MRRAAELYLAAFMAGAVVFVGSFTLAGATPSRAVLGVIVVLIGVALAAVLYLSRTGSQ